MPHASDECYELADIIMKMPERDGDSPTIVVEALDDNGAELTLTFAVTADMLPSVITEAAGTLAILAVNLTRDLERSIKL